MRQRLVSTIATEWRLVARARIPVTLAGLVVVWVVAIGLAPEPWRRTATSAALFVDIAGLGLLVVPALVVGERTRRTDVVLRLTPQPVAERVFARVAVSITLAVLASMVLVTAVGTPQPIPPLLGVGSMSVLFGLISLAVLGEARTLIAYMTRLPPIAVPLILPALVDRLGMWDSPLLALTPVTDQLSLLAGESIGAAGWAWQAVWWAGAAWAATHPPKRRSRPVVVSHSRTPPGEGRLLRLRSLLWADRTVILGDPLALMVLVGVPATAGVARLASTVGIEWAEARFGVDLDGTAPLLFGLLVVVHTPVLVGSVVGLMMLEDRDAGMWPLVATTRLSFSGLVSYRCGLAASATAVLTLTGLWIAGAAHPLGPAGIVVTAVVAGLVSPLPALVMTALAEDRSGGAAVMKLLGVPLYAPLAIWWLEEPVSFLFSVLPTTWLVQAFWARSTAWLALAVLGAVVVSGGLALPLVGRLRRRIV